ncbi:DNA polymerase III subunit gamma/tau [Microbacterium mcarthurae (nom. nud.)]|uniref:DNA polymerase III subunit gamma/tau n=1 Tax=Microbacterium mcarthurae TaxID=3035918 RepID=A0ABW9GH08_9MICO
MSTPRDDDALSWDGDDDPTLDVGEKRAPERAAEAEHAPGQPDGDPEPPRPGPGPEPLRPEDGPEPLRPEPSREASSSRHPETAAVDADADADADHAAPLGNVGLVGIGMVAATFLLFAIGWLVAGFRLRDLGLPIPDVTLLALTVGAALAPLVWFVTVLALTRAWRTWQRFLMLILGIVLLVPWPFLSLGAFV